ncbi:uncharacterized protein LOC127082124 [Lathyrus oleraceus]|uniref:uncharacterized protein LOC127082124 n=1 Tax=Pisum sativum TaxID=3888 RepID=UPI0021D143A7|nr:uncharacterized protein LOC127082124 [Pisum sativum]
MSKCIKFENGLHPEIKKFITYQEIRKFSVMVNKCHNYDEDSRARSSDCKSFSDKRNGILNHRKPYGSPSVKGKLCTFDEKNSSGGGAPNSVRCYKCGEFGHHISECKSTIVNCFKCGKPEHRVADYRNDVVASYNCGDQGHISTNCQKPKENQSGVKVFPLFGTKTTNTDRLIRGTCYINSIPLISIIDTSEIHSFIYFDCAKRLGLKISSIVGSMIVDTSALGLVTTSLVCLKCPLTIYGKNFGMDLVCLPQNKLNVILGMNWLEFNHMHINYYNKFVSFLEINEDEGVFIMTKQVNEVVNDGAQVFLMLASMSA